MPASGADNRNNNANDNIIFTIKDTKLYVPPYLSVFSPNARKCAKNADEKNSEYELSKLISKGFERSVDWKEYETKRDDKNTTNEFRYFLKSNFVRVNRLFVLVYLNRNINVKRFNSRIYCLPEGLL